MGFHVAGKYDENGHKNEKVGTSFFMISFNIGALVATFFETVLRLASLL